MEPRTPRQQLVGLLVRLAKRLLRFFPKLVYRILEIALNPRAHLRQLLLVACVQICSFLLQRLRNQMRRGILIKNDTARAQDDARTYKEWFSAEMELSARNPVSISTLSEASQEFFSHLHERTENYKRLQREGDEYGLMYHLRSELMRRQAGGAGYARDGSKWLREHAAGRSRIQQYEKSVCAALRYIGSGEAPGSSHTVQRLAFINETRHAFGRTALLLSGGASFGVKHLGVVAALSKENLLPRIICGTSAGSILAAAVCSRDEAALVELLDPSSPHSAAALLIKNRFFGLRRGFSSAALLPASLSPRSRAASAAGPAEPTRAAGVAGAAGATRAAGAAGAVGAGEGVRPRSGNSGSVDLDLKRGWRHLQQTSNLLDRRVLEDTILDLVGQLTFLEAFDRTGRVLNIAVTRSDGKAPPLLCNYLTTPHLLVHSACLASCAIPGVFEAVELMAKGRDGNLEPYFKSGGWTFTDGGLQADLPKERLKELFNVNQFIVSQVNPLAPLFVPVTGTGLPWLEELNSLIKHQLVGFVQGISTLWSGRLVRPGGFRGVDFVLQDYEGTVTIKPSWGLRDLAKFLSNFDQPRIDKFFRDGERATYPKIELIRSLCEIEFCLDEIAAELQASIVAARRFRGERRADGIAANGTATSQPASQPASPQHAVLSDADEVGAADGGPLRERTDSMRSDSMRSDSLSNVSGLTRGKVPSYVSLCAYGSDAADKDNKAAIAYPVTEAVSSSSSLHGNVADRLPGVASSTSLLNVLGLDS